MVNFYYNTIRNENDITVSLFHIRKIMDKLTFSEMEKQKVLVTVSELTRNILDHTDKAGSFCCEVLNNRGVRLTIKDEGKGILHIEKILHGSYKNENSHGLGLGLAGAKRLMDEFTVETSEGGTTIVAIKWREEQGDRKYRR